MKVTHVVRQFAPAVGGLEQVVSTLVTQQAHRFGMTVNVVTLDRVFGDPDTPLPKQDQHKGVPVTRIPYFGSNRYPIAPGILAQLRDADIVHVHAIDFFFDFLAATRPIHRRRLVASTHGGFFHTTFGQRLKRIYFTSVTRTSCRAYDRIIASSDNDAQSFGSIAPKQTIVIENGVDCSKFAGAGAVEHIRTMIYFGRFSTNKRLDTLFPLLKGLRQHSPDWRLVIAGREFDHTAADLGRMAEAAGVADSVAIQPNPTDDALRDLISQASYFVCLSDHEGFGIAALEGMSAGLMPILSDIPPFRKLAETSGLGIILDIEEVSARVERISSFAARVSVDLETYRQHAQAFARAHSWDQVVHRYVAEYENVMAEGHPVAS